MQQTKTLIRVEWKSAWMSMPCLWDTDSMKWCKKKDFYLTFKEGDLHTEEEGWIKWSVGRNSLLSFSGRGSLGWGHCEGGWQAGLFVFFSFGCFHFHSTVSFWAVRKPYPDMLHYCLWPEEGRHEQHSKKVSVQECHYFTSVLQLLSNFLVICHRIWGPQAACVTKDVSSPVTEKKTWILI